MNEIIERSLGFTDEMMADRCESLMRVISKTVPVKKGRGADTEIVEIPKYKIEPEVMTKVKRSIEHYKSSGFTFRDYQTDIISQALEILKTSRFVYLAMEVRTGKTLTSLGIADKLGIKNVLFITKKKAISSIEVDYNTLKPSYDIQIINYESLHTVMNDKKWDLVVCDEAHSMGAYPKPSQRAQLVKQTISRCNPFVIMLSGTPTPESYSQMYHQVYGIPGNPFSESVNFYRFCDKHVKVRDMKIGGMMVRDYSNGLESILEVMKPFTLNYTQAEAGFVSEVVEEVLEVEMKQSTYDMVKRLKRDLVIEGKTEIILADTPVKLMMKVHQLCSGTIKFESGNSMIVDDSKAKFIKEHFDGCKIGIFYKFKEELSALEQVFGDSITTDLAEFDATDKSIALQIVSGREGISLRKADYLVYYNIDFSATSYWQSKDRMTTKERLKNNVYWIFSKGGIEYDIYKAVTKKKDYTLKHFQNDARIPLE